MRSSDGKNAPRRGRQEKRRRKEEQIREDLALYGSGILDSEEMRHAFGQKHHTLSTVGKHSLRVARTSLAICYALRRLNIPTDLPSVVTGSLCHDLGILGRDEKYASMKECSRQHPADSVELANRLVGELPEKTEDIISHHMWPVGGIRPPRSLEAAIVNAADKIAAVGDFVEGYEEQRPGVMGVVRELVKKKE